MASPEKTDQKVSVRRVEVPVMSPNTAVNLLRTDVDKDFLIAQIRDDGVFRGGRLRAFAEKQIKTCPGKVIGTKERRERYLEEVRSSHPFDSVPYLIAREPCLMLSNLTAEQLKDLAQDLRRATTDANRTDVASAISTIQGIFIGRASSRQE